MNDVKTIRQSIFSGSHKRDIRMFLRSCTHKTASQFAGIAAALLTGKRARIPLIR
jgi:hypothetical protein